MKGQTVHLPKRAWRLGLFFIGILLAGGVLLMYKGNDAVAQGIANKDGILTAEQVKVSFQSVSGKMVNEAVQESKELQVRLQQLEVQKDRLTLRAPEDGKVLKLLAKQGKSSRPTRRSSSWKVSASITISMSVKSRPSISMKARPWPVSPYPMASPLPGRSASSPRRRGLPI